MCNRRALAFIIAIILSASSAMAVTVGEFLDRAAITKDHLYGLKLNRGAALTEGILVKIGDAIGIKTETTLVTEAQVRTYIAVFAPQLFGKPHPPHHDHGKHKGKNKSPHCPDDL